MNMPAEIVWEPSAERVADAQLTLFLGWLEVHTGLRFSDYESLWTWSVERPVEFWSAIWEYCQVEAERPYDSVLSGTEMPFVTWFAGCKLNFVRQVFRHRELDAPAIIYQSEAAGRGEISWKELERQVAALGRTMSDLGVVAGDRVVGYLPNIPAAVIAFLAAASIGAIWSISAADTGPVAVIDRFEQIAPKLLVAADGYRHGGKSYDRRQALGEIIRALPTVDSIILTEHLLPNQPLQDYFEERKCIDWDVATAGEAALRIESLPAAHPLWILYSSGSTGLPKAIVHSHVGIIVTAFVKIRLHADLKAGDRVFWNTSTSWTLWNSHISCLLVGATVVLFDGAPSGPKRTPDWACLWQFVARERVNYFGAGAAFHQTCMKAGIAPGTSADLKALCTIGSTGSPLSIEGYRWLINAVKHDVWIHCVSGGADICGPFTGGVPTLPVYAGEMQCRVLGAAVHAFNEVGQPVLNEVGELVCLRSLPSMPLYFWGDTDNRRYLESYFDTFRGPAGERIWRHGDWLQLVPRPQATGAIIYGRSDATINRQGVRMGTAEFYRTVERFPEVVESLVVDLEYLGKEPYLALFIVLRTGVTLNQSLDQRLRECIRKRLSARHVPNEIFAVPDIPKTLTGKKLELPIKKLLLGHPVDTVISRGALQNPRSLDWFLQFSHRSSCAGL